MDSINENLLLRPPDPTTPTVAVDLEGTLTAGSTWKAMHSYLLAYGDSKAANRFFATHLPGYMLRKFIGIPLREVKHDWMRDLLRLFAGYPMDQFAVMAEWVVEQEIWPLRRKSLVGELESHLRAGRRVIVVSGMYEPLLSALLKFLPGIEAIGTRLQVEGETFSGELAESFNVGSKKARQLKPFSMYNKIHTAYGDSQSDLEMLAMSAFPVAVFPDRGLRRVAEERGWRILTSQARPILRRVNW